MIVSLSSPPPAPMPVMAVEFYVARRSGGYLVFDSASRGSYSRMASQVSSATIPVFIDPISAMWMGLVTVEQLGLPETTLAVLKLAMQDLIP